MQYKLCLRLFNDVVWTTEYLYHLIRRDYILGGEHLRIWKEEVASYFKVLIRYLFKLSNITRNLIKCRGNLSGFRYGFFKSRPLLPHQRAWCIETGDTQSVGLEAELKFLRGSSRVSCVGYGFLNLGVTAVWQ